MKRPETKRRRAWGSGLVVAPGTVGVLAAEVAIHVPPTEVPWLALAGLLYPLSLSALLLGVGWRLLAGRWVDAVVPLIVLGLTFPHAAMLLGGGAGQPAEEDLQVLTWNVRQFDRFALLDGGVTRDAVLAELAASDVDVICLQEAYEDRRAKPYVTARGVSRAVGLGQIHTDFEEESHLKEVYGVMTLSRLPIVRKRRLQFPGDPGNGALITDLRRGADTLRVINVHLSSLRLDRADYDAVREGPDAASGARLLNRLHAAWVKRSAQIKQVEQEVAASPHPVVVCGDFNDTPMSYVLHTLRSQGLVDAFSEAGSGFGGTYIGDLPPLRIDYVLSSESLEAVRVEVGESVLSDHRWVKAALRPAL